MTALIDSLTIRGFRGFGELTIPRFGKVNLITGKNNTGKSSVLEALRILASRGAPDILRAILLYREELTDTLRYRTDYDSLMEQEDFSLIRSLFLGYPDILTQGKPAEFTLAATGPLADPLKQLTVRAAWITRQKDDDELKHFRYTEAPDEHFGEGDGRPALSLQSGHQRRQVPLSTLLRPRAAPVLLTKAASPWGEGPADIAQLYLDPFSAKTSSQLGMLWDAIALTDAQDTVLKALQLISPDIQAVSMIGSDRRPTGGRTAIVRSQRFSSPIPLRSYGDGINRLFGIILSLCNVRHGILLIDEFENGLHYSVQPLVWKTIFQLARDLDVQVFATTHSRDCILAFQQAAAESPEDGQLTRLTRKGDHVLSTTFSEDELKIVADNDIEPPRR